MVRELAGWNPSRYEEVLRWPLREAMFAYLAKLREAARRQYDHAMLVWAAIAPHSKERAEAPRMPEILRGRD